MATVTGVSADRVLAIESDAIVDATVDGDGNLTFVTHGGEEKPAGNVKGPQGQIGPPGGLLDFWPVGSVYMSVTPTDPGTLFGGSWEAFAQGRVLVGVDPSQEEFNASEKTGGEKEHSLSISEMPNHTHSINHDHPSTTTSNNGSHNHGIRRADGVGNNSTTVAQGNSSGASNPTTLSNGSHTHTVDIPNYSGSSGSVGGSAAHNNLQPYMTCFMWRRTA